VKRRKEKAVGKQLWISVVLSWVLLTGAPTSQKAPEGPMAEKSEQLRHQFAVNVVRAINTAEAVDHTKFGSYSEWRSLLSNHADYFDHLISVHRLGPSDASFGDLPDVLPGWNLRMNIHADGQGYDLLLRDTTDKKCSYAVVTDERAVIWQSKTVDCEI
jgi:hypothetical protein